MGASLSDKTSMAATWHQAFSTHGLVWLVGHGLGPLYQHVAAQWSHFCHQDDEEKRKYSAPRHQVLRSDQGQGELLSIVWFSGPNLETPLLPLPSPMLPISRSREDEIIIAGQHVMEKIKKTWS